MVFGRAKVVVAFVVVILCAGSAVAETVIVKPSTLARQDGLFMRGLALLQSKQMAKSELLMRPTVCSWLQHSPCRNWFIPYAGWLCGHGPAAQGVSRH